MSRHYQPAFWLSRDAEGCGDGETVYRWDGPIPPVAENGIWRPAPGGNGRSDARPANAEAFEHFQVGCIPGYGQAVAYRIVSTGKPLRAAKPKGA